MGRNKTSSGFTTPKAGFTVIELAVVIAVISIIIGAIIVNYFSLHNEAKDAKAKSDLRVFKLALETYCARKMEYPADVLMLEGGSVLSKLPKDPFTAFENYRIFISNGYYAVWSAGANGVSGVVTINPAGLVNDTDPDDIGATNGACPNPFWN